MNVWYSVALAILKPLGLFAAAGVFARGFVAFAAWRTTLRNNLVGSSEPDEKREYAAASSRAA